MSDVDIGCLFLTCPRRFQGDFERAVVLGQEALVLFRANDHAWGTAQELSNLADAALYQGDVASARPTL